MKDFNDYTHEQMVYFMDWVQSDNVVYTSNPTLPGGYYQTQCNQYTYKFKYYEILHYWWKEYGQYIEWEVEVEDENENNFRR